MSYDFFLFRPKNGDDPVALARRLLDEADDALNPGKPDDDKEERKQSLAAALVAVNPALEVYPFDHAAIARKEGMTVKEARRRWRHLELNGPEDGNGIQIALYDDTADLTVPYWHHGEDARRTVWEVWRYLEVLEREGGFVTYDPQLERVLDLGTDLDAVLAGYARGTAHLSRAVLQAGSRKRPWWKFW